MEDSLQLNQDEIRQKEEEQDEVLNAMPPSDIIAFTEQRSCADIYRMYQRQQIDIQPDFQRGFVWNLRSQTLFIDSLMKQLPIPSLCVSLDVSSQKRLVIDGLQRINTIIKFLDLDLQKDFRLARTSSVDERISGKKVSQIKEENPGLYDILENVSIPITVLRCDYTKKHHMQYLYQIFYRLNSGGNKLYNQEIRNCIYQGRFNSFLKQYVRNEQWLNTYHVDLAEVENARFRYEEQLLRFFAFYYNLDNYKGSLSSFLNDYMDDNKTILDEEIEKFRILITETLKIAQNINGLSNSINIREAVLIGIAANLENLKFKTAEEINRLYTLLLQRDSFTKDELMDGLSTKEKVKQRINNAKSMFAE